MVHVKRHPQSQSMSREEIAESAIISARSSSAVEGIRRPFEGQRVIAAAHADYPPLIFPSTNWKS